MRLLSCRDPRAANRNARRGVEPSDRTTTEEEFGETTSDEFVTVLIRRIDCDFNQTFIRASGPAEFTYSPSLGEASVSGALVTNDGRTIEVDMTWEGVGGVETTTNTTTFPGFHGVFQSRERH